MKTWVIAIEFPVHHKVAAFTEIHLDVLACVDPALVLSDSQNVTPALCSFLIDKLHLMT